MIAKKKKSRARGKYAEWITDEGLLKIEGWARDGLTDEQIAYNMGVAYSTFRTWRDKYPAISAVLKRGKEVVDRQVENAMLKRALGYQFDEVTRELGEKLNPETGEFEDVLMVTKTVTKEVAPDTTAQIFWLKNRKPNEWRDRKDIEHSGGVTMNNPFAGLSEAELRKLAEKDG